jgi:hypothetical protein
MKNLIILILLSFVAKYSFAQTPFPTPYQNLGSANVAVNDPGGFFVGKAFTPPNTYADTTAANNSPAKLYAGSIIFTTGNLTWIRNQARTQWIAISNGGGGGGATGNLKATRIGFGSPVDTLTGGTALTWISTDSLLRLHGQINFDNKGNYNRAGIFQNSDSSNGDAIIMRGNFENWIGTDNKYQVWQYDGSPNLIFQIDGSASGEIGINPNAPTSLFLPTARGDTGQALIQGADGRAEWRDVAEPANDSVLVFTTIDSTLQSYVLFGAGNKIWGKSSFTYDSSNKRLYVGSPFQLSYATFNAVTQAANLTAETPAKFYVTGSGNDAFYIGNGTGTNGTFLPVLGGAVSTSNTQSSISMGGFISAANDVGGATRGVVDIFTERASDLSVPIFGGHARITTRPLLSFSTYETTAATTVPYLTVSSTKGVKIGTGSPASSLLLDVGDTSSRGVRLTPLTAAQRLAIISPVAGTMVFDTDSASYFQYTGSVWQNLYSTGGGGATPDLQAVTDVGATTTNEINVGGVYSPTESVSFPLIQINRGDGISSNIWGTLSSNATTSNRLWYLRDADGDIALIAADSVEAPQNILWQDVNGDLHKAAVPSSGGGIQSTFNADTLMNRSTTWDMGTNDFGIVNAALYKINYATGIQYADTTGSNVFWDLAPDGSLTQRVNSGGFLNTSAIYRVDGSVSFIGNDGAGTEDTLLSSYPGHLFISGATSNGYVLTSDANGVGTWQPSAGGSSVYVRDSITATAPMVFTKATGVISIDSSSMFAKYRDTLTSHNNRINVNTASINLKLNISDTSTMLSKYRDTLSSHNARINTLTAAGSGYWSLASGGTFTGTNTLTMGTNPLIFSTGVTTGTGATAGHQIVANSLTSGNGVDISSTSLTTGNLFKLSSTSTAAGSNTQTVANISTSGANGTSTQTTWGLDVANTHTGTTSTNIGARFTASGGTNNYPLMTSGGFNVINGTTGNAALDIWYSRNTSGGSLALLFGADGISGLTTRTASTNKQGQIGGVSYNINASNNTSVIGYTSSSTANGVYLGGGFGAAAATEIGFYTAAAVNTAGGTQRMLIDASGNVGIGSHSTISARLHPISTTEQLRLGYDASNYVSTTVGSAGGVTYDAVGSGAAFTFNDGVTIAVAKPLTITEGTDGRAGQTTLVAGTKAITVTGLTTSSRAIVTFVSVGGTVTTTWQYKAVCTANTITITAIDNTGTTNTLDTSILNYLILN